MPDDTVPQGRPIWPYFVHDLRIRSIRLSAGEDANRFARSDRRVNGLEIEIAVLRSQRLDRRTDSNERLVSEIAEAPA
jgi:hypothetical protein